MLLRSSVRKVSTTIEVCFKFIFEILNGELLIITWCHNLFAKSTPMLVNEDNTYMFVDYVLQILG